MKNFLKQYWPYFLVVFSITLPWFFHSGYIFLTDFSWGPQIHLVWYQTDFVLNVIVKMLSFVFPVDFIQKLFLSSIIFTILMGGKKIAEQFLSDKLLIFAISLFAVFNPFVYERLLFGQIGVSMAFGFFCLFIGYFLEYYFTHRKKSLILSGIWSGLAIHFSSHFIFFILALLLLFFIILCFQKRRLNGKDTIQKIWQIPLIFFFCAFTLNANWVVGNFLGKSDLLHRIEHEITHIDLGAFQTSGNTSWEVFTNVITLSGFWGKDQHRFVDLNKWDNWRRSFWLLCPFILYGLIKGLKKQSGVDTQIKQLCIGFLGLSAIAVVLAIGIRIPVIREINLFLFDNVPLYKGMREPQKWVSILVIFYLIILTLGFKNFFSLKKIERYHFPLKVFFIGVIIMQAPLLLWGFKGQVKATPYPSDWNEVDRFLVEKEIQETGESKCKSNVLFLPWHLYMSFSWNRRIIANPAPLFFSCPLISGKNMEWGHVKIRDRASEEVFAWTDSYGDTELLHSSAFNIKYIILAKELDWQKYSYIDDLSQVKLIRETETLKVYQVITSTP